MAIELLGGAEVSFTKEQRERLGRDFKAWVEQIEDDRRRMLLETYNEVQELLSHRSPVKSFPWLGASNVKSGLAATYADAFQSRLFEASTAHDPTNLVLPRGTGDIIPGLDREKWADGLQRVSRWIERDDMDQKSLMEEVTLTKTHYGDAWVYLPWEEQQIADITITKGGKIVKTPRTLYSKVMPKVIHPKDIFIRWDAEDHQLERLVGFQFDLDIHTLDEWEVAGIYDKEVAAELRKKLQAKEAESEKDYQTGIFAEYGTRVYGPDEFEEKARDVAKWHQETGRRSLKMLKMFARADMDGDGVPEEIVYEVEKEDGLVAYARYPLHAHRERPLIHFYFKKRPGSAYNIGIGEMMLNMENIINTGLRDHFDNNKVQNAAAVLISKQSGIQKGKRLYPGATYYVNGNPNDAVNVQALGKGGRSTTINEVSLLERWGQFIVGLSDFQLGMEPKSRTPATTMQASLQEASIRPRRIIEVMRHNMRKMHKQILALYLQNGDPQKLAEVASSDEEDKALFEQAFLTVPPETIFDSVNIDPDVSSDSFNRSARAQQAMANFAQFADFNSKIDMIRQQIAMMPPPGDPMTKAILLDQARGYIKLQKRILDAFEERDQKEMLPDELITFLEAVTVATPTPDGAAPGSSPAQASQGLVTGEGPAAGPVAPEGRPGAGQSRVPAATQANGGNNG